ncbi:MAG TPA: hypothetical protein VJC03_07815 [bacterium]|nr:hypothetical protein [bacterium]
MLILTAGEYSAGLFYRIDRLDEIRDILKEDPLLLWKFRKSRKCRFQGVQVSINREGFRGTEWRLKKKPGEFRIVCLGASPTFGWGAEEKNTYPRHLAENLQKAFPEKNISVLNASVIGYSSHQGRILLEKEILRFSPAIVTISYVINDVDRNRFFRSSGLPDKELSQENKAIVFFRNAFSRSRLYRFMERGCSRWFLRSMISGKRGESRLPQVRVSPEDYRKNLAQMTELCRRHDIRPVFVKIPLNLPLPPVYPETLFKEAEREVQDGLTLLEKGSVQEAAFHFEKAVKTVPVSSEAHFYLGVCLEKSGELERAETEFKLAKDYDAFRCRTESERYNMIMEELAREESIPVADVVSLFGGDTERDLFLYEKNDPIHFSGKGHKRIAGEIEKRFLEWELIK